MNNVKVSIIMSTFNDSAYIKLAIDSVLQQTFSNWEFIIINDASSDKTEEIVENFAKQDKRIRYYKNVKNKGLVANLITGVYKANGEYIARIDGDDEWVNKNKLKQQITFLEKNQDYGLVGAWANIIDTAGNQILKTKNPVNDIDIRNYILIENCFFHSSVVIRKKVLDKVGGYNISIKTAEDYELWLKIGLASKIYNIPACLINYRINPNGINSTMYNTQLNETIKIIQTFKYYYPNYFLSLILWYMRKYVPPKIKLLASDLLKNEYILENIRSLKKLFLSMHYNLSL